MLHPELYSFAFAFVILKVFNSEIILFRLASISVSMVPKDQKEPDVRKFFARNSGAGNGCANFMGAWKNSFCRKTSMPIKFLVLGGGGVVFWFFFVGGGGECRFYSYGREDCSEKEGESAINIPFHTKNDVETNSLGVIFRNIGGISCPQSLRERERRTFSRNYAQTNDQISNSQ